jgi:hypothetical protein
MIDISLFILSYTPYFDISHYARKLVSRTNSSVAVTIGRNYFINFTISFLRSHYLYAAPDNEPPL